MNDIKTVPQALRVMELFAGVGGFRLALESIRDEQGNARYDVAWSNQHEPGCRKQYAAQVYKARWGEAGFINRDIDDVLADAAAMAHFASLSPDMLVAGFPCQDYSVARPASQSEGLQGKKGVLWWSLHKMLQARLDAGKPLHYLLLENVDRLINTPAACRGRDFAVILASLQSLGYAVEWRVVNSADYGFPQRRRRTFILAYHQSTAVYQRLRSIIEGSEADSWLTRQGAFARALPAKAQTYNVARFALPEDMLDAQESYEPAKGRSRFQSAGICAGGSVVTAKIQPAAIGDFTCYVGQRSALKLGDIIAATADVPAHFYLDDSELVRWQYLKGAKAVERTASTGFQYRFTEGAVAFPDPLDKPARTLITSEGAAAPSRTSHVIQERDGRLRRLVPEELEALSGFPRGFTDIDGISERRRAFLIGNALVVGIVALIGDALWQLHAK